MSKLLVFRKVGFHGILADSSAPGCFAVEVASHSRTLLELDLGTMNHTTVGIAVCILELGSQLHAGVGTAVVLRVEFQFEFNKFRVEAKGSRIRTWVNGHLVEDVGFPSEQLENKFADFGLAKKLSNVALGTPSIYFRPQDFSFANRDSKCVPK